MEKDQLGKSMKETGVKVTHKVGKSRQYYEVLTSEVDERPSNRPP